MSIKNIVAERILEFRQPGQLNATRVTVRIGAPVKRGKDSWSVVYEIRGPGRRRVSHEVWGVDSVQALHMAMANVPLDVRQIELEKGGKVTFLDSEDLRFPSL